MEINRRSFRTPFASCSPNLLTANNYVYNAPYSNHCNGPSDIFFRENVSSYNVSTLPLIIVKGGNYIDSSYRNLIMAGIPNVTGHS
ncbi:hypothetical protein RvY_18429 [Ramazzottius varieornatus]|uniref:Uncharacterized protein n=1 Tax=Ramazzottius varieornatus TaxID=947166 RepID=A0A1D1W5P1_RAMVA|nr:hypothetical protein RvY_18429 [Ramazzottius varieornatus]